MAIDWAPDLTVNEEVIDGQHVELFRLLSSASDALDRSRADAARALASFEEALLDHVATEKQLMEEAHYPERARHDAAHDLFVADLERVRAELAGSGATPLVAEWVRRRIPEWLRFHIRVNDAPLGAYLVRRREHQPGEAQPLSKDGQRPS
jgi:hemerythrin